MSQDEIRRRIGRPLAFAVLYSAALIMPLWAAFLGYVAYGVAGDAIGYFLP